MFSVIFPVGEDLKHLQRTIQSVRIQTRTDWELLAVDFASKDGRNECLQGWARRDPRIRVGCIVGNRCPAAARNAPLKRARGEFIAYLDPGDEYYPHYLAEVAAAGRENDVLLFGFDITYETAPAADRPAEWNPGALIGRLFAENIVPPMGVAHRRSIVESVGGFNELLWCGEDWDLWKRLSRAGLRFALSPKKCGRHRAETDTVNHGRSPTPFQLATLAANWHAGRPIFTNGNGAVGVTDLKSEQSPHPNPLPKGEGRRKIVFVSPHCLVDPTCGAAVATAQGLRFLQTLGFQCKAFCGARLDVSENIETMLRRHEVAYRHSTIPLGNAQGPVLLASLGGFAPRGGSDSLEVTIFPNEAQQQADFLCACDAFLEAERPDAVLTYGGDPLAKALIRLAKIRDLPLVFWLHNFSYYYPQTFVPADYVIVPSQFNRRYYWETIGLAAQVLPLVVDWTRVEVVRSTMRLAQPIPVGNAVAPVQRVDGVPPDPERHGGRSLQAVPSTVGEGALSYVTLVNPDPIKGLFVFARIAAQLAFRRPDIPLLVMTGRSRAGWQQKTGIDLSKLPNVTIRPSVANPREFYAATRLVLMPSLCYESFGLVAAEAMINGIPVLASNRGALPETIGDAGFLFDIPARYTPDTREVPMAEEVEPWVETIIRLWDDAAEYERWSRAARERARQWHPDRLAPIYREFFSQVTHQPGPPLVPRERGAQTL
jgi:glycosyltransferase involved in cell wall biosynthesis